MKYGDRISSKDLIDDMRTEPILNNIMAMDVYKNNYLKDMYNSSIVYFLWNDFNIVYIGQTRNMARRISDHYHGKGAAIKKDFNGLSWIFVEDDSLDLVETILIEMIKPKLNNHLLTSK